MMFRCRKQSGFSLVEMAVVLVIVGLLMAGLFMPITAQMDQKNYNETQRTLMELREALVGYALSRSAEDGRPYLPCPDIDNDGWEDRDEATGQCLGVDADVPWATLGLGQTDGWDNRIRYRVAANFASNKAGFTLTTVGNMEIRDAAAGNVLATDVPAVLVSKGKRGSGAGADELENSDGDTIFVSRTPSNEFDDLVVWLPRTVLFNHMVAAGRLP